MMWCEVMWNVVTWCEVMWWDEVKKSNSGLGNTCARSVDKINLESLVHMNLRYNRWRLHPTMLRRDFHYWNAQMLCNAHTPALHAALYAALAAARALLAAIAASAVSLSLVSGACSPDSRFGSRSIAISLNSKSNSWMFRAALSSFINPVNY